MTNIGRFRASFCICNYTTLYKISTNKTISLFYSYHSFILILSVTVTSSRHCILFFSLFDDAFLNQSQSVLANFL